jgi:hypothetical protein
VHLRPVAHPAQQPVGDARSAPGTAGDLGDARLVGVDAEQPRRAVQDRDQVGGVVVVEVGGEAEPVAQRRRQQAGAMAVAPGPFPTMTSTRKSSMAR